jgi:hypothetical protein
MAKSHDHPDERTLLGLCLLDYARIQSAQEQWPLIHSDFRLEQHQKIFVWMLRRQAEGHPCADLDVMRRRGNQTDVLVTAMADAALQRSRGDDETAEVIVWESARRIVGAIRSVTDRAVWYDQLFKTCGRQEIGSSDFLVGWAIGQHVKHTTGRAFPGYEALARETGQSVKTVERAIAQLSDRKHIGVNRSRPVTFVPIVGARLVLAKQRPVEKAAPERTAAPTRSVAVWTEVDDEVPF